ncbi:GFA family protein [Streptomyces salyersiae]
MNATPAADAQGAETAEQRTGGCLCGRIRFTTRGPVVFPHTCACCHCQKLGGTPVMWWVGFQTVTWTGEGGEPTWYETFEGEAKRGFCPTCVMQADSVSRRLVSQTQVVGQQPGSLRRPSPGVMAAGPHSRREALLHRRSRVRGRGCRRCRRWQ